MREMWMRMIEVDDPGISGKCRVPDMGGYVPIDQWCAVVGEPYGQHPKLPGFRKPLGDYMLIRFRSDIDAGAVEALSTAPDTEWTLPTEEDIPDEILMITDLSLARGDAAMTGAVMAKYKQAVGGAAGRANAKRALLRMVTQGVMVADVAWHVCENHKLDRDEVNVISR